MSLNIIEQFSLSGKKALIVGGAGDLGVSMVEALAQAGAQTVVIDLSDKLFEICKNFNEAGYSVTALKADVSNRSEIKDSFQKSLEILGGKVDILVNSAGQQTKVH